ncbi:MAG: PEGA domain-containing protein [Phycisphaerales bacterium JB039]
MIARAALLLALACACAGCLQRRIHITSQPPGATVWLNGVEIGRTPVEADFTFYGDYDVRLRKEGYEPHAASKWAVMPWYEIPPIDFVVMALPWTVRNTVRWDFELEPAPDLSAPDAADAREALLQRAIELRELTGPEPAAPPASTADQPPPSGEPQGP